jgi:hypothetical protein
MVKIAHPHVRLADTAAHLNPGMPRVACIISSGNLEIVVYAIRSGDDQVRGSFSPIIRSQVADFIDVPNGAKAPDGGIGCEQTPDHHKRQGCDEKPFSPLHMNFRDRSILPEKNGPGSRLEAPAPVLD